MTILTFFKSIATVLIVLYVSIVNCLSAFSQNPDDPLWLKAVEIAGSNMQWIPGDLVEKETVYDRNGKIEENTERHVQYRITENGEIQTQLLKTIFNGKDFTEDEKKSLENSTEKDEYLKEDEVEVPFSSEVQHTIQLVERTEGEFIDGIECVLFDYRQSSEGIVWRGKAWIAKKTGIPLKTWFTTDETMKEDNLTIDKLRCTMFYNSDPEKWYAERILYTMDIKTKVFPFYTFKGSVKSEIILSGYFTY